LSSPVQQILTSDHREVDGLLREVFAAVASADGRRTLEALDVLWARLAVHIRAEHLRLFQVLAQYADGDGQTMNLLARLKEDHNFFMTELAAAVKIARLPSGADASFEKVRQIVEKVAERLSEHDRIEESEVYPLAESPNLPSEDVDRLAAGIRHELDNLPSRLTASGPK
jgi:iron-sulfur cluster repair protein YtfE (RIC family)